VTAGPVDTNHYSYDVYADPCMAEQFDGLRFGGPIGRLVADTQEARIVAFLDPLKGRPVLDVGTGTGRAAIALARRGAIVTGVDASREMLDVAERRALDAGVRVAFVRGDAHALGFGDGAFDAAVCLRVLMHTPDWRRSLGELCRVARRRIVFDYPSRWSLAAIQAMARAVGHTVNHRLEAYRVFSRRQVRAALAAHGFQIAGEHRQFVLPIALHKRIGSADWTSRVEGTIARAGVTARFGSPVTIVAERCAS
jgi:2-polyprenyl-3-methyl-5-hydroxy-6-metoxy-1,4-benzoquinol methylase